MDPYYYDKTTSSTQTGSNVVEKQSNNEKAIIGSAVGGLLGHHIGKHIGIAAFGSAINGSLPLAILGGVVGYLLSDRKK